MSKKVDVSRLDEQKRVAAQFVVTEVLLSRMVGMGIERAEVWNNVVWVKPQRGSSRFISKKKIWDQFCAMRKERALQEHFVFTPTEAGVVVTNPAKRTTYTILDNGQGGYECSCPDYQNQYPHLGHKSVCKHIYAYKQSLKKA